MANINSKEHMFVFRQGKDGKITKHEVKQTSCDHKIVDNMRRQLEEGERRKKRFEGKS